MSCNEGEILLKGLSQGEWNKRGRHHKVTSWWGSKGRGRRCDPSGSFSSPGLEEHDQVLGRAGLGRSIGQAPRVMRAMHVKEEGLGGREQGGVRPAV